MNGNLHTLQQLKNGELNGISRLQMAENLTYFPTEIYQLADTLEILDLSNNQLTELPNDFAKLRRLKIVFLSNNLFTTFPSVLASCPNLEMIGFKSNQIKQVPEHAFPPKTRWLILTDNQITTLPDSLGDCPKLQKLMLAGNQINSLPKTLIKCQNLALIRLAANQLTHLPDWLLQLPKLAWLAFSGNPLCADSNSQKIKEEDFVALDFNEFSCGNLLGEGASGHIYEASWLDDKHPLKEQHPTFAVKIFKGQVTSDGYPEDELQTSLQIGQHPGLVKIIGHFKQHPKRPGETAKKGLLMEIIPKTYQNLGLPPSLQSCTRDTFAQNLSLTAQQTLKILRSVASSVLHLHQQGICHGDLYAHNLLYNPQADVLFGDFGAASRFAHLPYNQIQAIKNLELRAFGYLIDDLLTHTEFTEQEESLKNKLNLWRQHCVNNTQNSDELFTEIATRMTRPGKF